MNKLKGSTFENLFDEVEAVAIKRVLAYELEKSMKENNLSKSEMALKMHTSRTVLYRLLDPNDTSVTLHTLVKMAHVIGKKFQFVIP